MGTKVKKRQILEELWNSLLILTILQSLTIPYNAFLGRTPNRLGGLNGGSDGDGFAGGGFSDVIGLPQSPDKDLSFTSRIDDFLSTSEWLLTRWRGLPEALILRPLLTDHHQNQYAQLLSPSSSHVSVRPTPTAQLAQAAVVGDTRSVSESSDGGSSTASAQCVPGRDGRTTVTVDGNNNGMTLEDIDLIDVLWRDDIDEEKSGVAAAATAAVMPTTTSDFQYERDLQLLNEKHWNNDRAAAGNDEQQSPQLWLEEASKQQLYDDWFWQSQDKKDGINGGRFSDYFGATSSAKEPWNDGRATKTEPPYDGYEMFDEDADSKQLTQLLQQIDDEEWEATLMNGKNDMQDSFMADVNAVNEGTPENALEQFEREQQDTLFNDVLMTTASLSKDEATFFTEFDKQQEDSFLSEYFTSPLEAPIVPSFSPDVTAASNTLESTTNNCQSSSSWQPGDEVDVEAIQPTFTLSATDAQLWFNDPQVIQDVVTQPSHHFDFYPIEDNGARSEISDSAVRSSRSDGGRRSRTASLFQENDDVSETASVLFEEDGDASTLTRSSHAVSTATLPRTKQLPNTEPLRAPLPPPSGCSTSQTSTAGTTGDDGFSATSSTGRNHFYATSSVASTQQYGETTEWSVADGGPRASEMRLAQGKLVPETATPNPYLDEDDQETSLDWANNEHRTTHSGFGKAPSRGRQSHDEELARHYRLPYTAQQISNMPLMEFQMVLKSEHLTSTQLDVVRKIRRRGKNKVAARNCRKRKMQTLAQLQTEAELLNQERQFEADRHQELRTAVAAESAELQRLQEELKQYDDSVDTIDVPSTGTRTANYAPQSTVTLTRRLPPTVNRYQPTRQSQHSLQRRRLPIIRPHPSAIGSNNNNHRVVVLTPTALRRNIPGQLKSTNPAATSSKI